MEHVRIQGEKAEYFKFYAELKKLSNLKEFHFSRVDLYNADLEDDEPVENLWEALSKLESLNWLKIANTDWEETTIMGEMPSFPALAKLCQLPQIRVLNLGKFNLCNDQFLAVATALREKQGLLELDLEFTDSLDVTSSWPLIILTDMLQDSCSLQRIQLGCFEVSPALSNHLLVGMANSIARNKYSAIRRIEVDIHGAFHPVVAKAFLDMLKFNYTLEELIVTFSLSEDRFAYNGQGTVWEAVRFYVALNRRGRKKLIEQSPQMSKAQWINVLSQFSQEVEFLHYYLTMNPWLFHCQSPAQNRPFPSTNSTPTRSNDQLAYLSHLFSEQMQGMRDEMAKLNSKIDRKEAEKDRLLEEIQRLKEENSILKQKG
jgi:hypothetical protein